MKRFAIIISALFLLFPQISAQVRSTSLPACESNCDIYQVREFHSDSYGAIFRIYATGKGSATSYHLEKDLTLTAYDKNRNKLGEYYPSSLLAIEHDNTARVLGFNQNYSYDPTKKYLDLAIIFPSVPSGTAYVTVKEPGAGGWYWKNIATSPDRGSSRYSEPLCIIHSVKHRLVKTDNGEQLRFTVDATLTGCRGKTVWFAAFPRCKDYDGSYFPIENNPALSNVNSHGRVYAISDSYTVTQDQKRFQGVTLDVPSRRIPRLKGEESYYTLISVETDGDNVKMSPDHPQPRYHYQINWPSDKKWYKQTFTPEEMYNLRWTSTFDEYDSLDWIEAAANAGLVDAISMMASLYTWGERIPASLEKAEYWERKYVQKVPYSGMVDNSCRIDRINALKRFRAHNTRLSADDYYYLAQIIQEGWYGETKDVDRALCYMETAYRMNTTVSADDLADFYDEIAFSYILDEEYEKAMEMGMNAIRLTGNREVTQTTGESVCNVGWGHENDGRYRDAFNCYRVGAAFGSSLATAELARCYANGIYVGRDIDKAFALIKTAKELGYDDPNNRYWTYKRQIDDRDYAAYADWQRDAQDHYKRENKGSTLAGLVVVGALVAGVVALVANAGDSSSSSSSSSYSSSSSSSSSSYSSSYSSSSSGSSMSLCPDCSGRGMMNCIWCYGSGILKGGWFESDQVCYHCNGTGQKWCWHCNGKGSRKN